ncbi:hypothetical protein WN48_10073, partial [Eufriesea mexicana]
KRIVEAEGAANTEFNLYCSGLLLQNDTLVGNLTSNVLELTVSLLGGKVHGSLARAGKVKAQTPKALLVHDGRSVPVGDTSLGLEDPLVSGGQMGLRRLRPGHEGYLYIPFPAGVTVTLVSRSTGLTTPRAMIRGLGVPLRHQMHGKVAGGCISQLAVIPTKLGALSMVSSLVRIVGTLIESTSVPSILVRPDMKQFKNKTIYKARSKGSDGDSDMLSEDQMAKKPKGGIVMPQTSRHTTPALSLVSFCRKLEGEISASSKSFLVEQASELHEFIMKLQEESKGLTDEISSLKKQLSDKTKVEDKIKLLDITISSAVQEFVDLKMQLLSTKQSYAQKVLKKSKTALPNVPQLPRNFVAIYPSDQSKLTLCTRDVTLTHRMI